MSDEVPRAFPWAGLLAFLSAVCTAGLMVGGVFILFGAGWAMLTASVPFFLLSTALIRGLTGGK